MLSRADIGRGVRNWCIIIFIIRYPQNPIATLMCRKQASQLLLVNLITYSLFHLEEIWVSIISYISPNNSSHLLVKVRILFFFVADIFRSRTLLTVLTVCTYIFLLTQPLTWFVYRTNFLFIFFKPHYAHIRGPSAPAVLYYHKGESPC